MTDAAHGQEGGTDDDGAGATATLRTRHPRPEVVAAALAPDNTPEIDTRPVGGRVRTTVRREDVAGLRATVQDYLRNLDAADRTVRAALDGLGAGRTDDAGRSLDGGAVGTEADADEADTDTDADEVGTAADADETGTAAGTGADGRSPRRSHTDSPTNEDAQTTDDE